MRLRNNLLKNTNIYLAGSIENASDLGVGWRQQFTQLCQEKKILCNIYDPTNKPGALTDETEKENDHIQRLKREGRWDELEQFMKQIVRVDLKLVDRSDILVAHINPNIHMCGTYNEIYVASVEKKPILVICEDGKEKCPGWLFGIIKHEDIFKTVDACVNYLDRVNKNNVELDDRWMIVGSLNGVN